MYGLPGSRGYARRAVRRRVNSIALPAPVGGINDLNLIAAVPEEDALLLWNCQCVEGGVQTRPFIATERAIPQPSDVDARIPRTVFGTLPREPGDRARLYAASQQGLYDAADGSRLLSWGDGTAHGVVSHIDFATDANTSVLLMCEERDGVWQRNFTRDAEGNVTGFTIDRPPTGTNATDWHYLDTAGQAVAFDVEAVSFIAEHKQRIWVVEQDGADAWYLPVSSVSGELRRFRFGAKLPHGGKLLALVSFSWDGGAGPDDYLVAFGSGGDVALYQGSDPSQPDWGSVGSWYVGDIPETTRLAAAYGSDLLFISQYGLLSLRSLLSGQDAATAQAAPSAKINNFVRRKIQAETAQRQGETEVAAADRAARDLWLDFDAANNNLLVHLTDQTAALNLQTGGWSIWTTPRTIGRGYTQRNRYYFGYDQLGSGTNDAGVGYWTEDGGGDFGNLEVDYLFQTRYESFSRERETCKFVRDVAVVGNEAAQSATITPVFDYQPPSEALVAAGWLPAGAVEEGLGAAVTALSGGFRQPSGGAGGTGTAIGLVIGGRATAKTNLYAVDLMFEAGTPV